MAHQDRSAQAMGADHRVEILCQGVDGVLAVSSLVRVAVAPLIVGDDPVPGAEMIDLRAPDLEVAAEAVQEDDRRLAFPAVAHPESAGPTLDEAESLRSGGAPRPGAVGAGSEGEEGSGDRRHLGAGHGSV